jgi:methionyl aminopeptidase
MKVEPGDNAELVKSREEIEIMRKAGRELARICRQISQLVHPGVSTLELDKVARQMIEETNAKPAFLGYHGYPASVCTSIDEEVVHGIPSRKRCLREGEILSIDVGLILNGFFSDMAVTVPVGRIDPETSRLVAVTRRALEIAVEAARPGKRVGDISVAVQRYVEGEGFSVVRQYTGHGIGRQMHEEPKVPNFGEAGKGMRLRPRMVLALEPMVTAGTWRTETLADGWTVVTQDRRPAAHCEHTVALTDDGAEILTV